MDALGDRMKEYEGREASRRGMNKLPLFARLDGKRFSKFTRGLRRPFDLRLTWLMIETMQHLIEQSAATVGFTQSDEITLMWYTADPKTQLFLDRRLQKMTSILASMATAFFNNRLATAIEEKAGHLALFDCRVWNVPTLDEAANTFLWRELDATKNSISMAAREHYSDKELFQKDGRVMQEMLHKAGVNWNDYPAHFKRGTFMRRRQIERTFTAEDLAQLPPKHDAHKNPHLILKRSVLERVDMPPFSRVTNRAQVLFDGADPMVAAEVNAGGLVLP